MQILVEMIAIDQEILTPIAASVGQRVINTVEEELKEKPQARQKIPSPQERFSSASTRATSEEKSKARRPRCKRISILKLKST